MVYFENVLNLTQFLYFNYILIYLLSFLFFCYLASCTSSHPTCPLFILFDKISVSLSSHFEKSIETGTIIVVVPHCFHAELDCRFHDASLHVFGITRWIWTRSITSVFFGLPSLLRLAARVVYGTKHVS